MFKRKEVDSLIYWVRAREHTRIAKERGDPKPWTQDPILQQYRFCNVRRMDDKVSQWLLKNWYPANGLSKDMYLIAGALARTINWPETLSAITDGKRFRNFDYLSAQKAMDWRKVKKQKVFTGAYIINGAGGGSKIHQVLGNVQALLNTMAQGTVLVDPQSMERTHARLMRFNGFGSFIAGQVVADLFYTPALRNAKDVMTWAPIGPGSRRGMRRLLGMDPRGPMTQKEFQPLLVKLVELIYNETSVAAERGLIAMDIQNCLCEFDKYRRVQEGGRMRNRYPGVE